MTAPLVCGTKTWPSKAAAKREISAYKAKVREGVDRRVTFIDAEGRMKYGTLVPDEDLPWIYALFTFHPRAGAKFAAGVNEVAIAPGKYNNSLSFFFKSDNGVWDDISVKNCLGGYREMSKSSV